MSALKALTSIVLTAFFVLCGGLWASGTATTTSSSTLSVRTTTDAIASAATSTAAAADILGNAGTASDHIALTNCASGAPPCNDCSSDPLKTYVPEPTSVLLADVCSGPVPTINCSGTFMLVDLTSRARASPPA